MSPTFLIAALAAIMTVGIPTGHAKKVTFFEHQGGQGDSQSVEFEGLACFNILSFNDKATSVHTHDNCILAFEDIDCAGRMERIAPGTPSHGDLGDFQFSDMITSFRQCSPDENTCRQVSVDVDTSEAPDMYDLGQRMKQTIEEWYPSVCRLLHSPTLGEVGRIKLRFDGHNDGVAGAGGDSITAHAKYYRDNPNDLGSMIHEMAHIIQHYRHCAGWLTEGIADYPRRWWYESEKPTKPTGQFEGSSHTYFLRWIDERWPNTIYHLNKECRDGTYHDGLLERLTGKNAKQLWDQMKNE